MNFTRFMRVPLFVTGAQVTADNMDEVAAWCQGHVVRDVERPFVRVPVDRPTSTKQTEGHVGYWVLMSIHKNQKSFKVYTADWLDKSFFVIQKESLDVLEQTLEAPEPTVVCCSGHPAVPSQAKPSSLHIAGRPR